MQTSNSSISIRTAVIGGFVGAIALASTAFANGGHSGGGSASGGASGTNAGNNAVQSAPNATNSSDDLTTCPSGKMWQARQKRCVPMRKGALSDEETADYAYALAKAARYEEALSVLDLMDNSNTAEALNYRGYATRKLGRTDEGIGYYLRSVALDPTYAKVREYLGEAYVIQGRTDLAKEQLGTIKTLCGTDCESYRDLSEAIDKAAAL